MNRTRVVLADDHVLTREGLRLLLEPHVKSIDAVSDGQALVEAAFRLKPDLIILDVTMPLLTGIQAAVQIKKSLPATKLLFVTMHVDPDYLEAALSVGASGYVLKSAAPEELLSAMKSVMGGQVYVSPSIAKEHLERSSGLSRAPGLPRLSKREEETLRLVSSGMSRKEIAFQLGVSVKTVAFHRARLQKKLGLHSTAELTKHAFVRGLL